MFSRAKRLFMLGNFDEDCFKSRFKYHLESDDAYINTEEYLREIFFYSITQIRYLNSISSVKKNRQADKSIDPELMLPLFKKCLKYIQDLLNPNILFRQSADELNWKLLQVINESEKIENLKKRTSYLLSINKKYLRQKFFILQLNPDRNIYLEKDLFEIGIDKQLFYIKNILYSKPSKLIITQVKPTQSVKSNATTNDNKISNSILMHWERTTWYGSLDNLLDTFNWCIEHKYLDDNFKNNMKLWINTCFILRANKIIFPREKSNFNKKVIWHGTASSLLNLFKILIKELELIRSLENRNAWICDHFMYWPPNKKLKKFNEKSMNELWSSPYVKNIDFNSLKEKLGKTT